MTLPDLRSFEPIGVCICGAPIFASLTEVAVIHETPLCENFKTLEVVEFLKYVRRSRGISDYEAERT